jgi:hypothetical protein
MWSHLDRESIRILQIPMAFLGIMALKEIPPVAVQQRSGRKAHTMRKKYFGEEYVFEFIWQHCDNDGVWSGNDETLAAKFNVTKDTAYDALSELCVRDLIQRVGGREYIVVNWRERDDRDEEELPS